MLLSYVCIPYTCDCLDLVHLRSSRLVTVSLVVWGPVLVVWTSFTNYWTMSPLHFTLRSDGQWMCMTQTVPLISSIHHVHYMCVVCILMATVYSKFKYVKPSMQRSSTVYMYMYMYPLGGAGISLPIPSKHSVCFGCISQSTLLFIVSLEYM